MSAAVSLIKPELIPPSLLDELQESAESTAVSGQPDPRAVAALRASGLLGAAIPVVYGGAGGDAAHANRIVERVATVNPSIAIILFQHFAVSARIDEWGSPEQKAALLPAFAAGRILAASAWSETGAGAAKKKLATTGTRLDFDRWLLQGAKSFTTGAGVADIYLILAQTSAAQDDPASSYGSAGQSFFLVRKDNPGLIPDLSLDLVGMRGSATGFISLRDCQVADTDRLGPLGEAPKIIAGVRETGATLGSVSVGIAEAAFTIGLANARKLAPEAAQALRHRLVKAASLVEAARALVSAAGQGSSGVITLQSKVYASTVAEQVCMDVARMLGSVGYIVAHQLNRLAADARAIALMGPTNELCRELVAQTWQS
jgi:alkylation response protein AidB-like acyl-CoA dehydrogenase